MAERWSIVLGGWQGIRSTISSWLPKRRLRFTKAHTLEDFQSLTEGFRIIICDKLILIKNLEDDKVFIEFWGKDVVKNELVSVYVRGAHGSHGQVQASRPISTFFLPEYEYTAYYTQIDTSVNEYDYFQVFAIDFEKDISIRIGLV